MPTNPKLIKARCEIGEILEDAWIATLEDDTVVAFSEPFMEAWNAWTNHKAACQECEV